MIIINLPYCGFYEQYKVNIERSKSKANIGKNNQRSVDKDKA